MTRTYDSSEVASSYDKARLMPGNTLTQWMDLLLASVPADEVSKVLDLGSGTGRFSFALANRYKCPILAVDPSEPMLQEGQKEGKTEQDITWLVGAAEDIPAEDSSVDMVWMSQAFHHIDKFDEAFKEIRRALTETGYLVIRNGMRDHIDEIIWYECFPEAAEIERGRLMLQKEMVDLVCRHGFRLCTAIRHYQHFAQSYHEYADKICGRGLSALIAISDDAFNKGAERLKDWIKNRPAVEPVYEPVDLLVFRRT